MALSTKYSDKAVGGVLVAGSASLWALDGVLRRSLYSLPPIVIVFWEHLIGLFILAGILVWRKEVGSLFKSAKTIWVLSAIIGLLSGLLGTLLFTAALQSVDFIPFSVVLLLQKLQPIFAGATAVWLLKEKVTRQYVGWAAAAVVSAFFVTFPAGQISWGEGGATAAAALMALGAAAAWGSGTTLSKMLLNKTSVLHATILRFSWTTLFSLIALGLFVLLGTITTIVPDSSQLLTLLAIALTTGMAALYLYYQGLKRTSVLIATIAELMFPALAVALDIFLYGSVLQASQYLAAICLVVCMVMVVRSNAG